MVTVLCIHELTADWCALCTGRDDPTIPSPEPIHPWNQSLENQDQDRKDIASDQ